MKIFSLLLTLSALVTVIRADLSKYYDSPDYSARDYEYYDDHQYEDMAEMEAAEQRTLQERRSQGVASASFTPSEGVDFSGCTTDPQSGLCCLMKEEEIQSLEKDPILECTHKNTEQCHYTYVTQFKPSREEVCEESFDKKCSITFIQQARNETVEKCYRPLVKVCGETETEETNSIADTRRKRRLRRFKKNAKFGSKQTCQTYYETSCTTRYVEKTPGKFVADTSCEKLPVELCGEGCRVEEGKKECHEKVVASLVDVPQEVCDLNPVKTCRFATKLVPHLSPTHQCTIVPREVCVLKYSTPRQVTKPLVSKWCLDTSEDEALAAGQSEDESEAVGGAAGAAGPALGPNISTSGSAALADLDTYSSQSHHTSLDAVEADTGYGSPPQEDLDSLSDEDLDSSVDLSQEQSYVAPPESTKPTATEKPDESRDNYGSSTQNIDESYGVEDSYIIPSEPSLAEESYEIPSAVEESQEIPTQVDETYVIPSQAEDSYVIPSPAEESYVIPSPVEESYVIPSQVDEISQPSYGSTEASIEENDISDVSPVNSFYEVPSYDYDEDLDSYKSNEIPSYQANPESFSTLAGYKIDSGYGQEPLFSYVGAADDRSDSPKLSRHLLPPASELINSNKVKSKPNRIRSVDPYYYKI